jgi:hypothetical protein
MIDSDVERDHDIGLALRPLDGKSGAFKSDASPGRRQALPGTMLTQGRELDTIEDWRKHDPERTMPPRRRSRRMNVTLSDPSLVRRLGLMAPTPGLRSAVPPGCGHG